MKKILNIGISVPWQPIIRFMYLREYTSDFRKKNCMCNLLRKILKKSWKTSKSCFCQKRLSWWKFFLWFFYPKSSKNYCVIWKKSIFLKNKLGKSMVICTLMVINGHERQLKILDPYRMSSWHQEFLKIWEILGL